MSQSFYSDRDTALPDPTQQPEFYQDVPGKRLIAWVIDVILIGIVVGVLVFLSVFTALFILPVLWLVVSFLYRWLSIASSSATPGMRVVAIELRRTNGERLDGTTALMHTGGYLFSTVTFPLQLISVGMMAFSARNQGLTDMILGTTALNRGV